MDLSVRAIHDVVHPTAVFASSSSSDCTEAGDTGCNDSIGDDGAWTTSQLNPKNRIDSLAPLAAPLWRIDGSAGFGTQFYAYPLFLQGHAPMHIDVFVHNVHACAPYLRALLDTGVSFHTKDAQRVRRLGIAQHILRILQWHTLAKDGALRPDAIRTLYENGPYGSRIVIEDLSCHIHQSRIVVSPNYPLENDLISYQGLVAMWGIADSASLPPEISIDRVHLVRQLHDSISEVYLDDNDGGERAIVVLKSLSSGVKYMYQEIRALLKDIPPHPHVLARPLHIVTKKCLFGAKRGVVGFTMPLLRAGSLRDALPLLRIHGNLHVADQLRWARQITEAMCHVWHAGHSFYPDLRLDNVVLTAPAPDGDAGLVDFEQRGVWSSFSAPEVDHIENIRLVAFDDQDDELYAPRDTNDTDPRAAFQDRLVRCYEAAMTANATTPATPAGKRSLILRLEDEVKYSNPALSYNVSWSCLTACEQEAAMVYMLGRLLWCIFEGMGAPHAGAVWQSYAREPDLEFPAFRHATPQLQQLMLRCFGDADAREQSKFRRQNSKLYIKQEVEAEAGRSSSASYELVSDHLQERARAYWKAQLDDGHAWLQQRNERLHQAAALREAGTDDRGQTPAGETKVSAHGRPTLNQVLQWIKELEAGSTK